MVGKMEQEASASGGGRPWFTLAFGGVQLALALAGLAYALRRLGEAGPPPVGFWGGVALALFCGGLAQINLVGPLRGTHRAAEPLPAQVLPVRLPTLAGSGELAWQMLSLAFAFGAPALPMAMVALRLAQRGSDAVLLAVGATLVGLLVGGITLYLGLCQLYLRMVGGEMAVEIGAQPIHPGASVPLFVRYRPGRFSPEALQLSLVCRETTRHRQRNSYRYETRTLHDAPLHTQRVLPHSDPWQQHLTLILPPDAPASTDLDTYPTILWTLDATIRVSGAPDYRHSFPLSVESVVQDTGEE